MSDRIRKIAEKLNSSLILVQEGDLKWKLYDESGNLIAEDLEALERVDGRWSVCRLEKEKAKCEIIEDGESKGEVEVYE